MRFKNQGRNEFGKTDTPENTIDNITKGFSRLGYDIRYTPFQMAEGIHWSHICIDAIKLECQGKGMTPALAKASAHAELAERFSFFSFRQSPEASGSRGNVFAGTLEDFDRTKSFLAACPRDRSSCPL